jgi:ABC-type transport system involved in cytochrome bd biosynthesis fused ATPase/permease subunit
MRGRLLILIGLIILLAVIAVVVILPSISSSPSRDEGHIIMASGSANAASYNSNYLVFPDGTTDWKTVGDNDTYNRSKFYCKIDEKWHQCFPVEVSK